jgi:hypothetical protein
MAVRGRLEPDACIEADQQREVEPPGDAHCLEQASARITAWWEEAFLSAGSDARHRSFLEAEQTLAMLDRAASPADLIDAMKVQRIRPAKDQGLRSWEPAASKERTALAAGFLRIAWQEDAARWQKAQARLAEASVARRAYESDGEQ